MNIFILKLIMKKPIFLWQISGRTRRIFGMTFILSISVTIALCSFYSFLTNLCTFVCINCFDRTDLHAIWFCVTLLNCRINTTDTNGFYRDRDSGKGMIWLTDLACTGTENRLDECQRGNSSINFCTHGTDIGIICSDH